MKKIQTTMTEEYFWEKINTPIELTEEELAEINKVPSYEEIQKSIKERGMGFITYAKNHREKQDNLSTHGVEHLEEIKVTPKDINEADGKKYYENNKYLEIPNLFSTQKD